MTLRVIVRGGGDLSSGVVYRLMRAGWRVMITELPNPLAVRRLVSFSQAVYDGQVTIEGVEGRLAQDPYEAIRLSDSGIVPVLIDPRAESSQIFQPHVIVDGRMMKTPPEIGLDAAPLVIGLGPGFTAELDCHAVIETKRGAFMGRVYWSGGAEADTGLPDSVVNKRGERVLRAPCDGVLVAHAEIGSIVERGQTIAEVEGCAIKAEFPGVLRGLIHPGLFVQQGLKIGDIDPRLDREISTHFSDKSLAVGGGVLEAILSRPDLRPVLWAE